uniref:Uncharacterized protein n=1 Tax=Arundo donax TaxID=35708 RepID=A0A0A9CW23_ARUDO
MECRADRLDDRDNIGAIGETAEAEQPLELLQPDHNGRARHEPHDGRVRQEIHQKSQPEQSERDLEDAGEEGDGEDQRPVGHRVGGGVDDLLDHRRQQQRDDGDGADGDLPRRPHDGVDQGWHDTRVKTVLRVQLG